MRELTVEEIRSCVIAGGVQQLSTVHVTAPDPGPSDVVTISGSSNIEQFFQQFSQTTLALHAPTGPGPGAVGIKPTLPPESQWKSVRNNPGDLEWAPWEAKFGGSQTSGSAFATFATEQDGINAMETLLTSDYGGDTINAMISAYAPPQSNPTATYQANVANWSGLSGDTQISTLNSSQMESLLYAMARQEGNTSF